MSRRQTKDKDIKTLSFRLTTKQYSDFWYAASLLGENRKKPALLKMLAKIKELFG